jgi:hypothetical protein
MRKSVRGVATPAVLIVMAAGLATASGVMLAQSSAPAGASAAAVPAAPLSRRENLTRLMRPVTVNLAETRVEDALKFVQEQTGAEFEVLYRSDTESDGLDRELLINVEVRGLTALQLLEKILDAARDGFAENTWQFSEAGAVQIGPKSRLNRFKRVQIYDINDLLFVLPQFTNAPTVDLDKAIQSGGGGGGGSSGSPFKTNDTGNAQKNQKTKEERARDIVDLIINTIEAQQWADNGGEGGSITYKEVFSGQLIVNAADYLHRELNGYSWWPAGAVNGGGRRYVTLDATPTQSSVEKPIRQVPVSGSGG